MNLPPCKCKEICFHLNHPRFKPQRECRKGNNNMTLGTYEWRSERMRYVVTIRDGETQEWYPMYTPAHEIPNEDAYMLVVEWLISYEWGAGDDAIMIEEVDESDERIRKAEIMMGRHGDT